jgi:syndecan 4
MWLMRALLVFLCISHTSAQCSAGQYSKCESCAVVETTGWSYLNYPDCLGRCAELTKMLLDYPYGAQYICEPDICSNCCALDACASYCSNSPVAVCTLCPLGTYGVGGGATACTKCGAGKYSGVAGAKYASTCTNCPAGQYSGVSGVSACTVCEVGKTSTAGASACTDCGAGTSRDTT